MRFRSGRAHCDQQLAVEVRSDPGLAVGVTARQGAYGWGPAGPTATGSLRLRSGEERRRRKGVGGSTNPHLTGGEQEGHGFAKCKIYLYRGIGRGTSHAAVSVMKFLTSWMIIPLSIT